MGIFDVFTGQPAKDAAEKQRQYLGGVGTTGRGDIDAGYNTAIGAVNAGHPAAMGYLDQGVGAAQGLFGQARGAFDPLSALGRKYGQGTDLYLDALGVRGAEGNARATSAFTPSQSYQFNLGQGLEAINRARNARGMANSGNTDREAQDYGAGLASKEHGGWLDRLGGLINPELAATSGAATGIAGLYGKEADLLGNAGVQRAALETGRAKMLSDLATGAANQRVGLATGLASPYSATYKTEADAEMGGSANLWKLGLEGAKLGANFLGGKSGGDFNFSVPGASGYGQPGAPYAPRFG